MCFTDICGRSNKGPVGFERSARGRDFGCLGWPLRSQRLRTLLIGLSFRLTACGPKRQPSEAAERLGGLTLETRFEGEEARGTSQR